MRRDCALSCGYRVNETGSASTRATGFVFCPGGAPPGFEPVTYHCESLYPC